MRVAVERLDGVESAEVSLNEGRVRVRFAPSTQVSIAELRTTIRNQGFSPQEATLTVSARMERRSGTLVAIIPGAGASYIVEGSAIGEGLHVAHGGLVQSLAREGMEAIDLALVCPAGVAPAAM